MFNSLKMTLKTTTAVAVLSAGLFATTQIQAGVIAQCGFATCTSDYSFSIDGNIVGKGLFSYDAGNGDISLGDAVTFDDGLGNTISVNSLSGNADPILGFGVGASTGAAGSTFGFTFNLPIALTGQIDASSSVSYSLTSLSAAGAQVAPVTSSNIVTAFEVDTSVGGLASLNKGVDVGDKFFFLGGPATNPSPVYTASNTFTGNLAYDQMTVKIDFALSPNSTVGMSGFVQQIPQVPVPAAVWLFGSGLIGLITVARRKIS